MLAGIYRCRTLYHSSSSKALTVKLRASWLSLVCCCFGCGGPEGPAVGQVRGKVTLEDQPVAGASVQFVPKASGRTSTAVTDDAGNYVLLYDTTQAGALVGKHLIRVSKVVPKQLDDNGKEIKGSGQPELFHERYNTNSEVEKEVKAGDNVIDLELVK